VTSGASLLAAVLAPQRAATTSGSDDPTSARARAAALAAEFEGLLLARMLEEMRKAGRWSDDDEQGGLGAGTMLETIDVELATHLARAQGLGLARQLLDALGVSGAGPRDTASTGDSNAAGEAWSGAGLAVASPGSRALSARATHRSMPADDASAVAARAGAAARSFAAWRDQPHEADRTPAEPLPAPAQTIAGESRRADALPGASQVLPERAMGSPAVHPAPAAPALETSAAEAVPVRITTHHGPRLFATTHEIAVTSGFGWRRDPIDGRVRFHKGIDLHAAYGVPVTTPAAGRVVFAGTHGGYGMTVVVEHPGGVRTRYAHLSLAEVSEGDEVRAGQVIGRTGQSGRATGPHLHFEVLAGGEPVDPQPWLRSLKHTAVSADSRIVNGTVTTAPRGEDHED
jgi:murein DD-endopeptidase MepM/ murein hydrolase activator NlpD